MIHLITCLEIVCNVIKRWELKLHSSHTHPDCLGTSRGIFMWKHFKIKFALLMANCDHHDPSWITCLELVCNIIKQCEAQITHSSHTYPDYLGIFICSCENYFKMKTWLSSEIVIITVHLITCLEIVCNIIKQLEPKSHLLYVFCSPRASS